ncbi:MAG: type IV pilus secretin PilQ [Deltaproteobacteria bacterium]|nr:type IV pilus secretin PilQ [Deltaproteobacteria bacterium]
MRPHVLVGVGLLCWMGLAPSLALAAAPTTVGSPQVSGAQDRTEIRIPLTGPAPVYSAFKATSPDRLIVDLTASGVAPGAIIPSGGMVSKGEIATFNDGSEVVRLIFFVNGPFTHEFRQDGSDLVVSIVPGAAVDPLAQALSGEVGRLSGPAAPIDGPALTTLDFAYDEKSSRVVLGLQATEPSTSRPSSRLIAIDLPGARMPSSLSREIDSSRFASAIALVKARPTRAGIRVEIELRQDAEYSVKREGSLYIVEVLNPPELVARRAEAPQLSPIVAPSTPSTSGGQGLGNASGGEVLIGASGRTVDPQAKFGTGAGADDPSSLSFADDAPGSSSMRFKGRRMSIDLQEADIHTVFRFIADTAELNIVASDDVTGTVTVRLKDVPWDQALAAVLQAKGMGAQRFGNIIRVAPIETIKAEQQAALEAKKASDDLEPLQIYVAPLDYADAEELSEQIKAFLTARGSVQVDDRSNQLIIKDVEASIAQVRELLKRMDKQNRAVNIEARFVEATSAFTRSLGVQWGGDLDASSSTGYSTGLFFPNDIGVSGGLSTTGDAQFYSPEQQSLLVDLGSTGTSGALSFSLGSIPGLIDIDARLSALEQEGWGRVVSSPRLSVVDNGSASITQGAKIPFETVSQGGTQVQLVNAALEFTVSPHVTTDGNVSLKVSIKNNRPDFSQTVQGRPAIAVKEIETEVLVADGDTAVLGGVYATEEAWSQERVPGLGSIPLLGYLFKNSLSTERTNEMLVFITPRVVPES